MVCAGWTPESEGVGEERVSGGGVLELDLDAEFGAADVCGKDDVEGGLEDAGIVETGRSSATPSTAASTAPAMAGSSSSGGPGSASSSP